MLLRNNRVLRFQEQLIELIAQASRTDIDDLGNKHRSETDDLAAGTDWTKPIGELLVWHNQWHNQRERHHNEWKELDVVLASRWKIYESVSYTRMLGIYEPWRRLMTYYSPEQYDCMSGHREKS